MASSDRREARNIREIVCFQGVSRLTNVVETRLGPQTVTCLKTYILFLHN